MLEDERLNVRKKVALSQFALWSDELHKNVVIGNSQVGEVVRAIATMPETYFVVADYSQLPSVVSLLTEPICYAATVNETLESTTSTTANITTTTTNATTTSNNSILIVQFL